MTLVRLGPKKPKKSVRTQMAEADRRNARLLRQKFDGPMRDTHG